MADKTINEFSAGLVTNSSDAFIFQSAEGTTYKLFWSRIAEKLISDSFVEGSNITLTKNGSQMRISASGGGGSSYMPGNGISIRNGEIAVKIGDNLSFDPETGAINVQAGSGSSYTAGDGIDITANEISIDISELDTATPLTSADMSSVFLLQRANGNLHKLAWGNIITQIIQQHIAAGDNVSITYSTSDIGAPIANINAADTTYTAGTGISISNAGAIGVKLGNNLSINAQTGNIDAVGDTTYTAGNGIDISSNSISLDINGLTNAGGLSEPAASFVVQKYSDGNLYKYQLGNLISSIVTGHIGAGDNVSITYQSSSMGAVPKAIISATGTNYTAGDGIDIANNAISVKLGENLSLDPDTGAINASGDGTAATIQIGTVTTGEPGTNASVTNSGTSSAAIFNFTIPRGNAGANGTNGTNGYSISASEQAITGGHRVTISSTDPNASDVVFDVTNGANGNDGDDGYSISATTTTITGGHRVTISSTDPEATDSTFDVMDGVTTIQTTSDNTQITLTAADWVGNAAPYTQTVTILGMTSSIVPIIGLVLSSTVETGIEQEKQWGYVTKAESGTDSITFSCYRTKPTIDLTVAVKAV